MDRIDNTGNPFEDRLPKPEEIERPPGSLLGEHYEVLEERRGGMGIVFICRLRRTSRDDKDVETHFALKTFQRRLFFDSNCRIAFLNEAKLWTQLSEIPHVMPVLGIEEIEDQPFILMPAVPPGPNGEITLHDYLKSGSLEPVDVLRAATEVSLAMSIANATIEGIVHGDLKPHNFLIIQDTVFVADFGLARVGHMASGVPQLQGTWAYQAPETFETLEFTQKSDIYAFGVSVLELLTGQPLFEAKTREEWAKCHATQTPSYPEIAEPIGRKLVDLAMTCVAKDTGERPANFAEIQQALSSITEEWDPVQKLMWMANSARLKHFSNELRAQTTFARASGLIKIGEHQAALEILESVPEDLLDGETRILKGTVLSLVGRDEEAIGEYETALQDNLEERLQIHGQCELALSLKRLGRFSEAIDLFKALMHSVPDDFLPNVVINLATVYMQAGQLEKGEGLLSKYVRRHGEQPLAWLNLGWIRELLNRPEEALDDYERALRIAPGNGEALVRRAAVLMDSLDRVHEAWTALDMAFDQGFESREWFIRSLACARLLGFDQQAETMVTAAKTNIGMEIANEMIEAADGIIARIRSGKSPDHRKAFSSTASSRSTHREPSSESAQEEQGVPETGFRMPFLNLRMYGGSGQFTIDYYDDIESQSYLDQFKKAWYQVTREDLGGMEMRATPLYFTQCPGCGLEILTNRDHGKALRCRNCSTSHDCTPLADASLAELLNQAHEVVELKLESIHGHVLVVIFQCADVAEADAIAKECQRAGFVKVPERNFVVAHTILEGINRGLFEFGKSTHAWQKRADSVDLCYAGETPSEVEVLIRRVRARIQSVKSMSTSYNLDDYDPITSASLTGDFAKAQYLLEQELVKSPNEPATMAILAEMLCAQEKYRQALQPARGVTALTPDDPRAWTTLGRIEMQLGRGREAIETLERALELDPTDTAAMYMLAHLYAELGDETRARVLKARCEALGGPIK
ncbi:MAG: tetratricopeptide repeat protein [Desulfobacteraceae bacterium]